MNRLALLSTLALAAPVAVPVAAAVPSVPITADAWEAHVTVHDGDSRARASFGVRPDATASFDRVWDVPARLGSGVNVYLAHPEWQSDKLLARDIRAAAQAASFDLTVDHVPTGTSVRVIWDLRFVPKGCDRVDLYLSDPATGARVDMRLNDDYSFVMTGEPRLLSVESDRVVSVGPAAPNGLEVRPADRGHVALRWRAPAGDPSAVAYHVYRHDPGATTHRLTEMPIYDTAFTDVSERVLEHRSRYEVRAVNMDMCEGVGAVGAIWMRRAYVGVPRRSRDVFRLRSDESP